MVRFDINLKAANLNLQARIQRDQLLKIVALSPDEYSCRKCGEGEAVIGFRLVPEAGLTPYVAEACCLSFKNEMDKKLK